MRGPSAPNWSGSRPGRWISPTNPLINARSSDENAEAPFVEYLRALHAKKPLDLIVSIGAPAAAFVQRHRENLFAGTPMVFTAVDERRVQFSVLTPNDAVVAVRIDYLDAIKNILQVLPDTKKVVVIVGTSPIEKFWQAEIGREIEPLADRVTFAWTNELSFEEILKHAAALPPHTAIFWELMIVDAAGVVHEGNAALARLHAVANAPLFSYDDSFFGGELVGGPMLSCPGQQPAGRGRGHPHPRRRESGRHQGAAGAVCGAEVRLAADAALGNSRGKPAARQSDLFP